MITGVNYNSDGNQWAESTAVLERDFARWASDGISIVSVRIMSSVMAPSSPTTLSATALSNLRRVLDAANKYGVRVHLDFWTQFTYALGRASWIGGNYEYIFTTAKESWKSYMRTVIAAVKGYPAVEVYSVCNEPFVLTKAIVQPVLQEFYDTVKAADPARLCTCRFTLSYTPGSGKYDPLVYDIFDVFEITEYLDPRNPNDSRYNSVWSYWDKTISDLKARSKRLWVIEFGGSTDWRSDAENAEVYRTSLEKFKATGIVDRAYAWTWCNTIGWTEKFNLWTSSGVKPAYYMLVQPEPTTHILVVTSAPILGVPIIVNEQNYFTPTSPITLPEGGHSVSCPSNILVGSDTYNFSQWEDGSTNPQRMITLVADATIITNYVLVPPPPEKGRLEVHAFLDGNEITANGLIVETGQTFQTPTALDLNPGTYTVRVTADTKTSDQWATITENQTVRLDFSFFTPPPGKGILDVHAKLDANEIIASVEIVGVGSYSTPFTLSLDPATYNLKCTVGSQTQTKTVALPSDQTVRVDFQFITAPIHPRAPWMPLAIGTGLISIII